MKDCRRDPYAPSVWRKPWPIPIKPSAMPACWPSNNAFPAGALCFGRGPLLCPKMWPS
jgi:hypothetical protein